MNGAQPRPSSHNPPSTAGLHRSAERPMNGPNAGDDVEDSFFRGLLQLNDAAWRAVDHIFRIIADEPGPAIPEIELLLLAQIERPGADATEDADVDAALVHSAVAVEGAANGMGVAAVSDRIRGNQLWRGPRTEALVAGRIGRRQLHDAQAVLAVGEVSELADVSDGKLDIVQVVDEAAGVVDLIKLRLDRALDVEDNQAVLAGSDVSIGAGQVDVVGLGHADGGDEPWPSQVGHVQD